MDKTSVGDRMKGYERISKTFLPGRTPVIIRLDGKSFHTFTKNLEKPFDERFHYAMRNTASSLMDSIQGAIFAYIQSDEISIFLRDWDTFTTQGWFNYNVQKMVSISAAYASVHFNAIFRHPHHYSNALFDSRAFSLSKEEVTNYFIWRQQDATRNSINMLGQHYFSHKELQDMKVNDVQDMLMAMDEPVNWNDLPVWAKRGSCVVKGIGIDTPPIFTANRHYIEERLDPSLDDSIMITRSIVHE